MENLDYAAFATRIIRAHGRRIADGDIDALPDLLDLADELDAATQHAVNGLRAFGYSWADIAARLGTTRQVDALPTSSSMASHWCKPPIQRPPRKSGRREPGVILLVSARPGVEYGRPRQLAIFITVTYPPRAGSRR